MDQSPQERIAGRSDAVNSSLRISNRETPLLQLEENALDYQSRDGVHHLALGVDEQLLQTGEDRKNQMSRTLVWSEKVESVVQCIEYAKNVW